ncbi:MAG: hypothetical protein R2991_14645 [Thermoanaerobaculia bacterium]
MNDPAGIMTASEVPLVSGTAVNNSSRYGDHNQMGIDPVDDCTFWFLGMYNATDGSNTKRVRIGAVRFEGCEETEVFADGFESGDTGGWTTTVGN